MKAFVVVAAVDSVVDQIRETVTLLKELNDKKLYLSSVYCENDIHEEVVSRFIGEYKTALDLTHCDVGIYDINSAEPRSRQKVVSEMLGPAIGTPLSVLLLPPVKAAALLKSWNIAKPDFNQPYLVEVKPTFGHVSYKDIE